MRIMAIVLLFLLLMPVMLESHPIYSPSIETANASAAHDSGGDDGGWGGFVVVVAVVLHCLLMLHLTPQP